MAINMLLRDVDAGILTADTKKRLKAHAYFFRAYRYFDLVRFVWRCTAGDYCFGCGR